MCIFSQPKIPAAPAVTSRPKSDEKGAAVQNARRTAKEQPGVFGDIFTSALGDANYGQNVKKR